MDLIGSDGSAGTVGDPGQHVLPNARDREPFRSGSVNGAGQQSCSSELACRQGDEENGSPLRVQQGDFLPGGRPCDVQGCSNRKHGTHASCTNLANEASVSKDWGHGGVHANHSAEFAEGSAVQEDMKHRVNQANEQACVGRFIAREQHKQR